MPLRPFFVLSLLSLIFSFSSCVKDDFDSPPADGEDPAGVSANTTIAELKQLFTTAPVQITDSLIIEGVVISSDKAGNFYKSLVIEDATAGIAIRIDQADLYADYPIGRRVFIKCKNLWLGDYASLVQLGGSLDDTDPQNPGVGAIPSALVGNYILKGQYNVPVAPIVLTIDQADNLYQNMLVQFNDVEFDNADLGQTFADAVNQSSVNRNVNDCNGNQIILRTSGYSSFAGDTVPGGHGTLTAIFSVFNADFQLLINDATDVQFDSARCSGSGGGSGIMSIRNSYHGSDVTLGSGKIITGIVISNTDNFDPKNLVVQDSTGGIVVRFTASHSFSVGDAVTVDVSGETLTSYNGLLEITNVPNASATKTGTGTITPRIATNSQILANLDDWESTLVRINTATITGSGTYSGTATLNDGTGALDLYTRTSASFASTAYPSGSVSVTGVLGNFNGAQLSIRSLADVQ